MAGPHQPYEFGQENEFADSLPVAQPPQLVGANDPKNSVLRMEAPEVAHGVDRITGAVPPQLEFGDLKMRLGFGCEAQHGQAVRGRGVDAMGLVRHLRGRHEDEAVQAALDESLLGGAEMAKMNGIESSAKKADVHGIEVGQVNARRKPGGNPAPPPAASFARRLRRNMASSLFMHFHTFLFDLDGTLIDHFAAIYRCYCHTMEELGLPKPTYARVRAAVGGGLENAFSRLLPAEHQTDGLRIFNDYWEKIMLEDVVLMPGAFELLQSLHARGAVLAVCSNKLGSSSRPVCEALGLSPLLSAVVGAKDTPWLKPDPRLTAHMLQLVGGEAGSSLLVGDSPFDVQAAHNGGLKAWCVTTGTHSAEQLLVAGADAVYPGLVELGRNLP
jgi:phosphoglycolate phosphatase